MPAQHRTILINQQFTWGSAAELLPDLKMQMVDPDDPKNSYTPNVMKFTDLETGDETVIVISDDNAAAAIAAAMTGGIQIARTLPPTIQGM